MLDVCIIFMSIDHSLYVSSEISAATVKHPLFILSHIWFV